MIPNLLHATGCNWATVKFKDRQQLVIKMRTKTVKVQHILAMFSVSNSHKVIRKVA